MTIIDLNSDLGEGFGAWKMGDDDALLEIVSSANIACGFHAGDPGIMRRVTERAVERGVAIGAHVAYRDLAGFGRRAIDMAPDELSDEVLYQIGALDAFAKAAGGQVRYVKPHGALYNTAADDEEQAWAVLDGIRRYDPSLAILCPPDSEMSRQAENFGVRAYAEAFADRAYTAKGTLVSRKLPGAVLHDADAVATRAVEIAKTGKVIAADGRELTIPARSLCVHGDTPGAVELAHRIAKELVSAGVKIKSFVDADR
jgi:UPF0271 protein